ncbi:hypothetical protein L6452_38577 [Arctium lappa]|uniref:Uncharacterized protein n=1 Tax=Arctium lappa TaxID=4217 RepID=A0ACB8XR36_ARCLA|nr:hypothetical protein L6452_38577 [Arctium lappa]
MALKVVARGVLRWCCLENKCIEHCGLGFRFSYGDNYLLLGLLIRTSSNVLVTVEVELVFLGRRCNKWYNLQCERLVGAAVSYGGRVEPPRGEWCVGGLEFKRAVPVFGSPSRVSNSPMHVESVARVSPMHVEEAPREDNSDMEGSVRLNDPKAPSLNLKDREVGQASEESAAGKTNLMGLNKGGNCNKGVKEGGEKSTPLFASVLNSFKPRKGTLISRQPSIRFEVLASEDDNEYGVEETSVEHLKGNHLSVSHD